MAEVPHEEVKDELTIPEQNAPKKRLVGLIVGGALVVIALLVFVFGRGSGEDLYRTAPVSVTTIAKEIRVTGHLELTNEVDVPAPVDGQLVAIFVQPGDLVEAGQLLAQLDRNPAELAAHVARAEHDVVRARVAEAAAAHRRATEAFQRTKRLAEKNLASDSTLERARSEASQAYAALQAARAERSAAAKRAQVREDERDRTNIVAPRSGLVLDVPERTGMMVGPAQRLFRLGAPPDHMNIKAPVGEADIGETTVGQTAQFEVPAFPGRMFEATVRHLSPDPYIEGGAVFYFVTLEADNPERLLLPGMTTQLRIKVAQADDVLAVREAALRFTPAGAPPAPPRSRIWRVNGSNLEEVPIETGISDGAFTEVRVAEADSVNEGDAIAIGFSGAARDESSRPGLSLRGQK